MRGYPEAWKMMHKRFFHTSNYYFKTNRTTWKSDEYLKKLTNVIERAWEHGFMFPAVIAHFLYVYRAWILLQRVLVKSLICEPGIDKGYSTHVTPLGCLLVWGHFVSLL